MFVVCCCVLLSVCCCLCVGCWCGCWCWTLRFSTSAGPLLRWTTLRWTAQNFALFSLSRSHFRTFSLGVFSLNFGGVFQGRDPQMCTFGLSACRVKPRRRNHTQTTTHRQQHTNTSNGLAKIGWHKIGLAQNWIGPKLDWPKIGLAQNWIWPKRSLPTVLG